MTKPVPVSIILPAFNRFPLLKNTLQSIYDQKYPNLEVLVIDDGSDDETRTLRKKFPIRYFYLNRPGWTDPSRPVSVGIRQAKHGMLIIAGAEMEHEEKVIELFVDHLTKRPKDWVFATVYDLDPTGRPTGQLSGPKRTAHGWFLCALKRKHLLDLGGFDEDFNEPAYDDAEIADRLLKHGLTPMYRTDIVANHQYHPRNHSPSEIARMAQL